MSDEPNIRQVGIVVKDLEATMENYYTTAGIGPWNITTNSAPPLRCIYHGRPAEYKVRVAVAMAGQLQMELLEYLEGDSIHRDFLASGRSGIEHIGIFVPNLDQALQPYLAMGVGILQQVDGMGLSGDGRYAYLDTEPILGTILELIQASSKPIPAELIYPATHQTQQRK